MHKTIEDRQKQHKLTDRIPSKMLARKAIEMALTKKLLVGHHHNHHPHRHNHHPHHQNHHHQSISNILTTGCIILSSLMLLSFLSLTAEARSVSEDSPLHNGHHNQLVSNRHQSSSSGNSNSKLLQTANNFNGNQNRCQQGWMWFNNKCWVTTQSRRDFAHAVELCKKMYNSTLPTIHSEEENEFLRNNIDLQNSPIWLYARHNHQYNRTRWLDKSAVDYTRWDAGQPSDKSSLVCIKTEESWYMKKAEPVDGQTECVSFWEDAKWGTQVGCLVLLPVVCEKKLTPISRLSDGPNGSISQFEQQQMSPISGAQQSIGINLNALLSSTLVTMTIALLVSINGAH